MRSALSGTPRKDGRWQLTVTLTRGDGAKVKKTLYAPTQREVQDKARNLLHGTGRTAHEKHTVTDLIEQWKRERWEGYSDGGKRQYTFVLVRLTAALGDEDVRELSAPRIARWLSTLAAEPSLSGRSVQIHRNALSVILGYANEIGWRDGNPAKGLRLPASAKPKVMPRLSPQTYRQILGAEKRGDLRDLWETLGETGLRPSEALALTSESLLYSMDMWWVRVGASKTDAGRGREVPLPDSLARRLGEKEGYLFATGRGTPIDIHFAEKAWRKVLRDAEIEHTNLYQLRKMCLSRWIANGLPDDVVKTLAGHADIRLTQNVYNRLGKDRIMECFSGSQSVASLSGSLPKGPV